MKYAHIVFVVFLKQIVLGLKKEEIILKEFRDPYN
jgi:hypothetical protein